MIGAKAYKHNLTPAMFEEWQESMPNCIVEDKGEYYEVVGMEEPTQEELNRAEVERLKAELSATDYKCLKYVDGALSDSEYAEVREYRAELRRKINELEE